MIGVSHFITASSPSPLSANFMHFTANIPDIANLPYVTTAVGGGGAASASSAAAGGPLNLTVTASPYYFISATPRTPSISIKLKHRRSGVTRRFTLTLHEDYTSNPRRTTPDTDGKDLTALRDLIRAIFFDLFNSDHNDFTLTWIDMDGDYIRIDSSLEFWEAVTLTGLDNTLTLELSLPGDPQGLPTLPNEEEYEEEDEDTNSPGSAITAIRSTITSPSAALAAAVGESEDDVVVVAATEPVNTSSSDDSSSVLIEDDSGFLLV